MFKVRVPATSANLGPGFDTAGIALQLYNEAEIYTGDEVDFEEPFRIESINRINPSIVAGLAIPTDENNLIYRTIKGFSAQAGVELPRFLMRQIDCIPLARGLGSSAACITAGLLIANELCGTGLDRAQLMHMAVKLDGHPDNVAPAFLGEMVVGASDGDVFKNVRIHVNGDLQFISLIPNFPLLTEHSRAVLPRAYTKEQSIFNCSRVALMVASMMSGNYTSLAVAMQDEIHQPYRKILIPHMEQIMKMALECGAYGACLSGAGPAILVLAPEETDVVTPLQSFLNTIRDFWLIMPLQLDTEGAVLLREPPAE